MQGVSGFLDPSRKCGIVLRRCSKGQEGPGITEDEGFRRRRDSPVRCARGILVLQSSEPGKKCAGGLRGARRSFCGGSGGQGGGEAVSARRRGALLRAEARQSGYARVWCGGCGVAR